MILAAGLLVLSSMAQAQYQQIAPENMGSYSEAFLQIFPEELSCIRTAADGSTSVEKWSGNSLSMNILYSVEGLQINNQGAQPVLIYSGTANLDLNKKWTAEITSSEDQKSIVSIRKVSHRPVRTNKGNLANPRMENGYAFDHSLDCTPAE